MRMAVLVVAATLIFSSIASAQTSIRIRGDESGLVVNLDEDLHLYTAGNWPSGIILLRADLMIDGSAVADITEDVTWSTSNSSLGVFDAPGELELLGSDEYQFAVSASLEGIGAAVLPIEIKPGTIAAGTPPVPDTPYMPGEINEGIEYALDILESLGIISFTGAAESTPVHDNATTVVPPWGDGVVGDENDALTIMPGLRVLGLSITIVWQPQIFVQHTVAHDIVWGNILDQYGRPTPSMITILHELLHVIIEEGDFGGGGVFPDEAAEEDFVHDFTSGVLADIIQVLHLLRKENLTPQEFRLLQSLLRQIPIKLEMLCAEHPGVCEVLLPLLGLEDEDGNGMPDIIDDAILQWVIDQICRWPFFVMHVEKNSAMFEESAVTELLPCLME